MSGERASRSSLFLPGRQQELLEAAVATGKPVVLILINGRPLDIIWASEHVPAILGAWYPGTEGGNAIADLLFGDAAPGGHLPLAWPRSVGQILINYARNLTHIPEDPNTATGMAPACSSTLSATALATVASSSANEAKRVVGPRRLLGRGHGRTHQYR